ncbi:MAG: CDP-alcohol phosphatidyltransferase family protein [Candidatus Hodarchaeota archaeon]
MESFLKFKTIIQKSQVNYTSPWYASKVIRKVTPFVTWILVKTPITANQVTFSQLFLSLIGLYFLCHKSTLCALFGTILLHIGYLFDCVDGELARYKNTQSINGMFLDFVNHEIIIPLIYACFAFHYYFLTTSIMYFGLGLIILMCKINPITKARLTTIRYLIEKRKSPIYDIRNYKITARTKSNDSPDSFTSNSPIIKLLRETRRILSDSTEYPNDLIITSMLIIGELLTNNSIAGRYFLILFSIFLAANFVFSLYSHLKHNVIESDFINYREAFSEIAES